MSQATDAFDLKEVLSERDYYARFHGVPYSERVPFRLIAMPCCGQMVCWVNPRLPKHCPECGTRVRLQPDQDGCIRLSDDNAWLKVGAP